MNKGITNVDGKFYKKCKVVMLPTEKESNVVKIIITNSLTFHQKNVSAKGAKYLQNQHLYILSDEEIKNDEWVLNLEHKSIFKVNDVHIDFWENDTSSFVKKIIATTNLELENCLVSNDRGSIYQKLPRPSDAFLKAYCDKGGFEEILVEYNQVVFTNGNSIELNIGELHDTILYKLKVAPDNTITIRPIKDSWNREEMRLEVRKALIELRNASPEQIEEWINKTL